MPTIYHRVLGERYADLSPALHRFLAVDDGRAVGKFRVTRASGRIRNLVAAAMGIPPAGEYDLRLDISPHRTGQRWLRHFGERPLQTTQFDHHGLLVEKAGPGSIGFELVIEDGVLIFRTRRAWVLGVPLPGWLRPDIEAENHPTDNGWRMRVCFRLPLLGRVAEYEGEVTPVGAS